MSLDDPDAEEPSRKRRGLKLHDTGALRVSTFLTPSQYERVCAMAFRTHKGNVSAWIRDTLRQATMKGNT